jgi:hypothetical protein
MPDSTTIDSTSESLLPFAWQNPSIQTNQPAISTSIVLNPLPLDFSRKILFAYYNESASELARFNRTLQQQIKQTTHWLKENETIILNSIDTVFIAILSAIFVFSACLPGIGPAFQKIATVMTNLWNGTTIAAMAGILPIAMQNDKSSLEWLRLTIDFSSTALLLANVSLQIASLVGAVIAPYIQPLTNAISCWCDTFSYLISYGEARKAGKETAAIVASLQKSLCLAVGATLITAGLIIATVVSHGALPVVFLAAKVFIGAAGLFASNALSSSKSSAEAKEPAPLAKENISSTESYPKTAPVDNSASLFSFMKNSFFSLFAQPKDTSPSPGITPVITPSAVPAV